MKASADRDARRRAASRRGTSRRAKASHEKRILRPSRLVEKGDFASGTSSKSSKMIHGGLRYLQQREFRLVYENLAERQRLLENAPTWSARSRSSFPSSVATAWSPRPWPAPTPPRCGSTTSPAGPHRAAPQRVTEEQALAHLPTLGTDQLVAGFLYFDARADDARLTLTVARTAALEHGAVVANYTPVVRLTTDESGRATVPSCVPMRPTRPPSSRSGPGSW